MSEAGEAAPVTHGPVTWPRRALLGLWLLVFAAIAVGLVARWDSLISRLVQPPVSVPAPQAIR